MKHCGATVNVTSELATDQVWSFFPPSVAEQVKLEGGGGGGRNRL